MIKTFPKYLNFEYLNGDIDSFIEEKKFVFVLMPFGKDEEQKKRFNDLFMTIKNVVESCFYGGLLKCSRADLENNLIIMEDICKKIKKAGLTIFDISVPNNNVYYELGLACALDKKIILLYNKNSETKIPFDINQFRYIEYQDSTDLEPKLKSKIERFAILDDFTNIDLDKVYKKLQKITRHLKLDSKSEQIQEDWGITEYEINKTRHVLDKYWNNSEYRDKQYKGIKYLDIEGEIRDALGGMRDWNKVKEILRYLYWSNLYNGLIAQMENLPSELCDIREDFTKQHNSEA